MSTKNLVIVAVLCLILGIAFLGISNYFYQEALNYVNTGRTLEEKTELVKNNQYLFYSNVFKYIFISILTLFFILLVSVVIRCIPWDIFTSQDDNLIESKMEEEEHVADRNAIDLKETLIKIKKSELTSKRDMKIIQDQSINLIKSANAFLSYVNSLRFRQDLYYRVIDAIGSKDKSELLKLSGMLVNFDPLLAEELSKPDLWTDDISDYVIDGITKDIGVIDGFAIRGIQTAIGLLQIARNTKSHLVQFESKQLENKAGRPAAILTQRVDIVIQAFEHLEDNTKDADRIVNEIPTKVEWNNTMITDGSTVNLNR